MGQQGQAWIGARSVRSAMFAATVVAATLAVSTATAEEPARFVPTDIGRFALAFESARPIDGPGFADFRPGRLEQATPRRPGRFYDHHLMPRLNAQFDRMSAYSVVPDPGRGLREWAMFDDLAETARHRAERGTRRALKYYLLEVTTLGRTLDSIKDSTEGDSADRSNPGDARRRPLRVGVKISGGLPKLDLRYKLSGALVRFGVAADGSLSAQFRRFRSTNNTWILAGYDAEDGDYNLACRLSF